MPEGSPLLSSRVPMLPFIEFPDLISNVAREAGPWDWPEHCHPDRLASLRAANKRSGARANLMRLHGWSVYSPVRAHAGLSYVHDANPAVALRGLVLDYDVKLIEDHLVPLLEKLPEPLQPQWVERTLSGNFRLVWVFSREVPVADTSHAKAVWKAFADRINPFQLHPGLDTKSFEPNQRWTNGGEWFAFNPNPVGPAILNEAQLAAADKWRKEEHSTVPLDKVAAEVEKRWPGRWKGDFVVKAQGVRFWDATADNPGGCQVRPDGMLCFTGPVAFVRWEELLGAEWVAEVREEKLESAIRDVHFDGRRYWMKGTDDVYRETAREDMILALQARGFSSILTKGKTISEVGTVLNLLQANARIDVALPLVNYRPGLQRIRGAAILNTSRLRALEPAAGTFTPEKDFPFLWRFLRSHFAVPERNPLDHFLAWTKRAYAALFDYRPLMGQAVFLCGPHHNGKTLLGLRVLAPLLGGAYADPYKWLTGQTKFNHELYESYLWLLNDVVAPNEGERGSVMARVKDIVVNPSHNYERKYGAALQIDHVGRLFATLNDDAGSVGLLPEVNSNTADKMMFFRSQPFPGEWPSNQIIEETLEIEVPRFARWLLSWTPPESVLERSRVGVKSYFDSFASDASRQQTRSYTFAELIVVWQQTQWANNEAERSLTPTELMAQLGHEMTAHLAREWPVTQAAKALTTLARDPESTGISFVTTPDGIRDRRFRILRRTPPRHD